MKQAVIVSQSPSQQAVNELFSMASRQYQSGDAASAMRNYHQLIEQAPNHAEAHHMLGQIYMEAKKLPQGLAYLQKAAQLHPGNAGMQMSLAGALRLSGQLQPAVRCYEKVIAIDKNHGAAYEGIGLVFATVGQYQDAVRFLQKALSLNPQLPESAGMLIRILHDIGEFRQVQVLADSGQVDAAGRPYLDFYRAKSLMALQKFDQAEALLSALLDNGEFRDAARCQLVSLYFEAGHAERSLEEISKLPQSFQQRSDTLAVKGQALNQLSQQEQAAQAYYSSIEADPENVQAWYLLSGLDPTKIDDDGLALLEKVAASQSGQKASTAWFALARLYQHRKRFADEFAALEKANSQYRKYAPYDSGEMVLINDQMRKQVDAGRIRHLRNEQIASTSSDSEMATPVFILGLPRSGSTLVEQILSSHSQVDAAGEPIAFFHALEAQSRESGNARNVTLDVDGLDIRKVSEDYLASIRQAGVSSQVFTDKGMRNFQILGLQMAAFPKAKLIRLSRHPLDVCFGSWKMLFNQGRQNFSYDLKDCARMYVEFNKMMDYWESQLPDRVFHLAYEDLVANQEEVTRSLLEFCGLPWEQACLDFHKNKRKVQTASINQVRKGLFTSEMGRWKRYGNLLDPLRKELERLGVSLEE